MAREEELGKLVVDIDADSSGLKRGLSTAKSALAKGISSMRGVLKGLVVSLSAAGAAGIAALTKMSINFLQQQKRLAILQNTYKSFAKNATRSFKDVQMGMFNLAKQTGVSTAEQAEALQQLMTTLNGLASPEYIQDVLLPLAIDWAYVTGKTPADAAKDIAEAFLGEAPEELVMPVKAKFELENPGKEWDSLAKAEQWALILDYLEQFSGSAEAASNTIWGAFARIKTAIEELFSAIANSADFQPLVDTLNDVADGIFNLAERIRNGDIPENLKGIVDGFNEFIPKVVNWLKNLKWEDIQNFGNAIKNIALIIIGYGLSDKAIELAKLFGVGKVAGENAGGIKSFWDNLGGLGRTISLLLSGGLIAKLGDSLYELGRKIINIPDPTNPFMESSSKLQKIINNIGGIILRFGKTMSDKGLVAAVISIPTELGKAFTNVAGILGMSTTALTGWITIIIAAIVGFVAAWKGNWGGLQDTVKEAWNGVKDVLVNLNDSIVGLFKDLWDDLSDAGKMIWDAMQDIASVFGFVMPDMQMDLTQIKDFIGITFGLIVDTLAFAAKTIGNALGVIVEFISLFTTTLSSALEIIVALFTLNWKQIPKILGEYGAKINSNLGDIGKYFANFGADLVDWFGSIIGWVGSFFGSFVGKAKEWKDNVKNVFTNFTDVIRNKGQEWLDNFQKTRENLEDRLDRTSASFASFRDDFKTKSDEISTNTRNWASDMGTKFSGFASNVGSTLKDAFGFGEAYAADMDGMYKNNESDTGTWKTNMATKYGEFATTVSNKLNDAKESIKTKFGNIKDSFTEHKGILAGKVTEVLNEYETLKTNIKTKIEAVRSTMSTNLSVIATDVKTKFNEVITNVKAFGTNFYNSGAELFNKLKEGLSSKFSSILQSIGGFIQDAVDVVKDWYYDFKTAGKGLIDAFWDGALEKWNAFKKWLDQKLQVVRDFLPGSDAKEGPLSTLTKAGRGLFSAMEDGMKKEFPNFLDMVEGAAGATRDLLPSPNYKDLAMAGASNVSNSSAVNVYITDSYFTSDRAKRELVDMIDEELGKKRK